jgi:dTDP-4-dehydrorhamnose reductase
MTILVAGGKGTVGSYFERLKDRFSEPLDIPVRAELDVTDLEAVMRRFGSVRYSAVVNLVGATDVDRCELEPEWAFRLNVAGAWNLALAARRWDLDLVQVSTVALFGADGAKGPFTEADRPAPVNVYAKTKLAGEERALQIAPRVYVVRTAWVMGGGPNDRKFTGKMRPKLQAGEPISAANDSIGSPTYAHDLVLAIRALLETKAYGLYHVTNAGVASRYEMILEMKAALGSSSEVIAV